MDKLKKIFFLAFPKLWNFLIYIFTSYVISIVWHPLDVSRIIFRLVIICSHKSECHDKVRPTSLIFVILVELVFLHKGAHRRISPLRKDLQLQKSKSHCHHHNQHWGAYRIRRSISLRAHSWYSNQVEVLQNFELFEHIRPSRIQLVHLFLGICTIGSVSVTHDYSALILLLWKLKL